MRLKVLELLLGTSFAFSMMSSCSGQQSERCPEGWKPQQWPSLQRLRSGTSPYVQEEAVKGMLKRLLSPEQSRNFVIKIRRGIVENGHDVFVLQNYPDGTSIEIQGSSGVAVALGFQYYAKEFCGCHFSWSGNQVATLPTRLPRLGTAIKVVTNDLFRYYQNVCTFSYSSVWWDWDRWEREIDWMALNGINLPLAFTGQEEIYRRVYLELGFSQADMDEFFTGPAFLAWNRMGNVDGWGGPLPSGWHAKQVELQHRILKRMRDFGMTPVLPSFSGHVPATIQKYYPDVRVTRLSQWGHFNSSYCCTYLLDFDEVLFQTIGQAFLKEMQQEFGLDHVYNCDTFNEMAPSTADPGYVIAAGRAVFDVMTSVDPDAVWMMQGWLFLESFWDETMAKALLTSVPTGRMLVLDLQSELQPQYRRLQSFFGQPWIWCMLHNFGGVQGLYGIAENVTLGPFEGRTFANSTMVGTGLSPEGIEQNDVMYELMNEMAYRKEPVDTESWFQDYSARRYGSRDPNATAAWKALSRTVFNCTSKKPFHGQFIITRRPSLKLTPYICYNVSDIMVVWKGMTKASASPPMAQSALFRHDLVDVTREALVGLSSLVYKELVISFMKSKVKHFQKNSALLLRLLQDLECVLGCDARFRLGAWIHSARSLASTDEEAALYEYNARNQITLWGPEGEILDYATKQWSGVVSDYYQPRWQLFIDELQDCLRTKTPFDSKKFNTKVLELVEKPFTFSNKTFAIEPTGDPVAVSRAVYAKWSQKTAPYLIRRDERNRNRRPSWWSALCSK